MTKLSCAAACLLDVMLQGCASSPPPQPVNWVNVKGNNDPAALELARAQCHAEAIAAATNAGTGPPRIEQRVYIGKDAGDDTFSNFFQKIEGGYEQGKQRRLREELPKAVASACMARHGFVAQ
jgi:hypothetical protein